MFFPTLTRRQALGVAGAVSALSFTGAWTSPVQAQGAAVSPGTGRLQSWKLGTPRRTGIHDVAPAPDGGVWFTAQASGHLGWFDPKTGRAARARALRHVRHAGGRGVVVFAGGQLHCAHRPAHG
ncbi:hypothetical protein [Rhodoferax sp.]|uniref:hypothetical protein n=1 Tax=Rhodoferax sp. TaxID=50421 RepID=UPI00351D6DA6